MSRTSTAPLPPTTSSILPPAEELDGCSQDGDAVGEGQGADTRQLGVPGEEQSSTRRHHVFQVTWQAQCRMEVGGWVSEVGGVQHVLIRARASE